MLSGFVHIWLCYLSTNLIAEVVTAHSSYRAESHAGRSKQLHQSLLFWSHERCTIKIRQSLGFYGVFVYWYLWGLSVFSFFLPPVSLDAMSQICYLCCMKKCGTGPLKERDKGKIQIWSTAKLQLSQDLLRASPLAHATPFLLIRQVVGEPHLQAKFSRNCMILNGLQCQNTAM